MKLRLTLDRFEGDRKEVAVLIDDQGRAINLPRDLLPDGVLPGEILSLGWTRERKATKAVASRARTIRKEQEKTDPGGDVTL